MAELALDAGQELRDPRQVLGLAPVPGRSAQAARQAPLLGLERERVRVARGQRLLHAVEAGVARLEREERADVGDEEGAVVGQRRLPWLAAGLSEEARRRAWAERTIFRPARTHRLKPYVAILLVAAALAAPVGATAAPAPLQTRLDRALTVPHVDPARTAGLAVDLRTGEVVFQRNRGRARAPAATNKHTVGEG